MAFTLDISDDFEVADGLTTFTFFSRTASGATPTTGGVTVANCLTEGGLYIDERVGLGRGTMTITVWPVQAVDLDDTNGLHLLDPETSEPILTTTVNISPKVSDVFQDGAGKRWSVVSVNSDPFNVALRVQCVKERG